MTRTSSSADLVPGTDPVEAEQPYVSMLYGKLDDRRAETAGLLARVLRDETTGTPQAVSERDAAAQMYSEQLSTLSAVENGLCFGRLDLDPDRPPPRPPTVSATPTSRASTRTSSTSGVSGCSTRTTTTSRC